MILLLSLYPESILNYLELNVHDHSIIAQIVRDSIKYKDAPVDAIVSIMHVRNLKNYEVVDPDFSFIAQIILNSIK